MIEPKKRLPGAIGFELKGCRIIEKASPSLLIDHDSIDPGGGERVRTDGLLRARQALSQLSYTPRVNL